MNRNDFLRMIEDSGPADRQAIGEVNELIDVFPYFQSAYLLLLKGLSNTSDVKFENQLKLSAIHIADREVLYYFLKKESRKQKEPEVTVLKQGVTMPVMEDSQQVVIETGMNSEELISEGSHSLLRPVTIQAESDYGDSVATVLIIDEKSGEEEERVIFMDPGFAAAPEEAEDLLELDIEEEMPAPETGEEESKTENTDIRKLQSDLIDKFIHANPRIEPVKEKTETPLPDISKPFTEERGAFVTETLARIYTNQGYYSRAIDIYETLSLKFPEKSSYFASQIEKVKELLKK
ncbi:MAG: hypothetical protein V1903_13625 [Bacteroidota bacterium]